MEESLELLPMAKLEHRGTLQLSMRKDSPTIEARGGKKVMPQSGSSSLLLL